MPRTIPRVEVYPMENYQLGQKAPLFEKDTSVKERMIRMAELYKNLGVRRYVEGLCLVHVYGHPHLLLFQIGNTYFKLPGGRLRVGESEIDGLKRKLNNKLGTPNPEHTMDWKIMELLSTWWRPNFETVLFPYVPPQVTKPKECRKMFICQMPSRGVLGVPKNLKLLAVPLFELYDNAHRYGPTIASAPQLISRLKLVFKDSNGTIMDNAHLQAYKRENTHVFRHVDYKPYRYDPSAHLQKIKSEEFESKEMPNDNDANANENNIKSEIINSNAIVNNQFSASDMLSSAANADLSTSYRNLT